MDSSQVEADLKARIEQSATWVEGNPQPISDLKLRNVQCRAVPSEFLDDPRRVEQHGVEFEFSVLSPGKEIKVRLQVRIKPEGAVTKKGDSWPYVVIYIVNQVENRAEEISHHHIEVPSSYEDLEILSIDDWYGKWLRHALASKGAK